MKFTGVVQISLYTAKTQANRNDSSAKNQQECNSVVYQIMKESVANNCKYLHIRFSETVSAWVG